MRLVHSFSILTGLILAATATATLAVGCTESDPDPVTATPDTGTVPTDSGIDAPVDTPVDTPVATAKVIAPTAMIDGKTYAQQSALWWQWALGIPKAKNPIEGKACAEGQAGNVFYLAGTADGKPATRACEVPEGKTLFFPLVNGVCYPCHEEEGCSTSKTEAELKECAKLPTLKALEASVDGVALTNLDKHLVTSAQFSWKAPTTDALWSCMGPIETNTCGVPVGDRFGVSEGYWVGLEPLAKGTHKIKFKAIIPGAPGEDGGPPGDDFVQDVTYDITIK